MPDSDLSAIALAKADADTDTELGYYLSACRQVWQIGIKRFNDSTASPISQMWHRYHMPEIEDCVTAAYFPML